MSNLDDIIYIEDFLKSPDNLYSFLIHRVEWDERMKSRKTASYGEAYNYSQINYPTKEFLPDLDEILSLIEKELKYRPNNCLINYYLNGKSKMGFHSDQTDILFNNTGVAIISLGETRILRFRSIDDKSITKDYSLPSGSFIYMPNKIQAYWQHAIPKSETDNGRMSLTFRKIKNSIIN